MNFKVDLGKIKIDPFPNINSKEEIRKEFQIMGIKEDEVESAVEKRINRNNEMLISYYKDIFSFLEPGFKELYKVSFNDDCFYNLINGFENGEELSDFVFSIRFFANIDRLIDPQGSGLKTLFLISFIESLTTSQYVPLHSWLINQTNKELIFKTLKDLTQENLKHKLDSLFEKYFEEYGAFRNVFNFLKDNLSNENKFWLLQKVTFRKVGNGKDYRPICFSEEDDYCSRIRGNSIYCCECKIESDDKSLNDAFKKFVRELYNMRSQFVHNAKYVHITVPPDDKITMVFDAYKREGEYFRYVTDVNYNDFKMLIAKATIEYLNKKHTVESEESDASPHP